MNALFAADPVVAPFEEFTAPAWQSPAASAAPARGLPLARQSVQTPAATHRILPARRSLPVRRPLVPSAALVAAGAALTGSAAALAFFLSRKPTGTPHGPSHVKFRA